MSSAWPAADRRSANTSVDLQLAAATGAADPRPRPSWGTVDNCAQGRLHLLSGDNWFQITAGQRGTLTVEASSSNRRGNVDLEIYDAQQRLMASSNPNASGSGRFQATAGGTYYVRVRGTNSDVDFRLTNLVSITGSTADILGIEGKDSFTWNGVSKQFAVNGVEYALTGKTTIRVDGAALAATLLPSSAPARPRPRRSVLRVWNWSAAACVTAQQIEIAADQRRGRGPGLASTTRPATTRWKQCPPRRV